MKRLTLKDKDKKKKKRKPTLKQGPAKPKGSPRPPIDESDIEEPRNVDPPDFSNTFEVLSQTVKLIKLVDDKVRLVGFNDDQQVAIHTALFL